MRLCFPVIFMLSLRHAAGSAQQAPQTQFVSEGSDVEISCDKDIASLLHWFRVTDAGGVEFLLSFKGDEVKVQSLPSNIEPKGGGRSLVVRDFRRRRDGGSYTCTRINNNQLEFGRVTVLEPPPEPTEPPAAKVQTICTTRPTTVKTVAAPPCEFPDKKVLKGLEGRCEIHIFSSLVAASGLLLMVLIATIIYCSKMRTRRCPHHYRKQLDNGTGMHAVPTRYV
ncbi:T-cell surface glycoprotein CD8 alpha chain isoform X2 [Denticeps clupeoides]|uniref:T-cell surface glycoprotein CD8 alpha chain isoform X2 n=1 Tax=Denticeps clupeoides TaxID=299321 RepID=UPI0010A58F85|nr:T-cell surface glycoprotein CD8 alpha chain isoform X2 [Denticeps clupeoides]